MSVRSMSKARTDELFTAVVFHALGETRSEPAPLLVTMKIARAWNRSGSAVRVEGQEGQLKARLNGRDDWSRASGP